MKTSRIIAVVALAVLAGAWNTANAAFVLRLTPDGDPTKTVTIADQGLGDVNGAVGAVTFIGPLGSFDINVTTGLTSKGAFSLDLNSVNHTNGTGSMTIELTDTDYTYAGSAAQLVSHIGGTTSGTVEAAAWLDASNTAFGHGPVITHFGPFIAGVSSIAFSGSATSASAAALSGPFSITEEVAITHIRAGTTSFDFESTAVPEPMSIAVWSVLGAAGAAWAARGRKRAGRWSDETRTAVLKVIDGKRHS